MADATGITTKEQETADRFYMEHGPCCAGCDWWHRHSSLIGECRKSAPVSADERYSIVRMEWNTFRHRDADAGHILTNREHHCGDFKDAFDWPSLPPAYLRRIGWATRNAGVMVPHECKRHADCIGRCMVCGEDVPAGVTAAPAPNDDSARLEWIERQGDEFSSGILQDCPGDGDHYVSGAGDVYGTGKTFREAIDNARVVEGKAWETGPRTAGVPAAPAPDDDDNGTDEPTPAMREAHDRLREFIAARDRLNALPPHLRATLRSASGVEVLPNGEVELTGLKRGPTRTAVARRTSGVPAAPAPSLPRSDSTEAIVAIEAVLAERNYPSSTNAAGRAGWEAAFRWLRTAGVTPPFERGSWQHAVDDHLVGYGRTSQEFATPHEAVQWLLQITSDAAVANAGVPGTCPGPNNGCAAICDEHPACMFKAAGGVTAAPATNVDKLIEDFEFAVLGRAFHAAAPDSRQRVEATKEALRAALGVPACVAASPAPRDDWSVARGCSACGRMATPGGPCQRPHGVAASPAQTFPHEPPMKDSP